MIENATVRGPSKRHTRAARPPAARTAKWDARRRALAYAAYQVIATRGFEGLRTRAVAGCARVNIGTLHYYFPGKEALVRGLTEYLSGQFRTVHAPAAANHGRGPLRQLRQEFADASYYQVKHRDLIIAMLELMLRGQRDRAVQRILAHALGGWRGSVREILTVGMQDGAFRGDLDADAAATVITALITGLTLMTRSRADHAHALAELERWLAPPHVPAGRRARRVGNGRRPKPSTR